MRHYPIPHLVLAGVLACAAACGDAQAPWTTGAGPASTPTPPPPQFPPAVYLSPPEGGVLVNDSVPMNGYVARGSGPPVDTLEWAVSDSTVASIRLVGDNRIMIHALRAGSVEISARTLGALPLVSSHTSFTVFARSTRPAPVQVIEFRVVEVALATSPPRWVYVPQLSLQSTGPESVRIVGVTLGLPGVDSAPFCSTGQPLGTRLRPLFPPLGDGNMLSFVETDHRTRPDAQAVARITVALDDGTATQLVVNGSITNETFVQGYNEAAGDWVQCN